MENLLVIDILFSSMRVSEIREIVTYGWGNFLGEEDKRTVCLQFLDFALQFKHLYLVSLIV